MKIDYKSFTKKWNRPPKNQFPTGTTVYKNHQPRKSRWPL